MQYKNLKPMQNLPLIWEELKKFYIKKLRAETDFSIDKMVNCRILVTTIGANMEKFMGDNITNCFEKWANIKQDHFALHLENLDLTMEFAELSMLL